MEGVLMKEIVVIWREKSSKEGVKEEGKGLMEDRGFMLKERWKILGQMQDRGLSLEESWMMDDG